MSSSVLDRIFKNQFNFNNSIVINGANCFVYLAFFKFKKSTYELITYAKDAADALGLELKGLSIGPVSADDLNSLGAYGIENVVSANNDALSNFSSVNYAAVLNKAVSDAGASVVIDIAF